MSKKKNETVAFWEPEFKISSGSYMLDQSPALANYKGIPSGTMIQISSAKEGSFKTSLALAGAREIQKIGGKVGYIDAEHGVTGGDWFKANGIELTEDLWDYYDPLSGEDAFSKVEEWMKSGEFKGIIVDSIDAAQPESILTADFGQANIGNHAKLVTQAVRRFAGMCRKYQCILWLINQMKVNFTPMGARGKKNMGGDAINFYCKLNIEMKKAKSESQLKEDLYIPLTMNIKRSKFGQSFIEIPTYGLQGVGIDQSAELIHVALDKGLIEKKGGWYKKILVDSETGEITSETIGQGMESARDWAIENKEEILS
jgi:recombination protein RecA